jgi:ABC-type uncharacterized transport system substrate-binding protein
MFPARERSRNVTMLVVELPAAKFEFLTNMKTGKAFGIKIPNSILVRADKVIE